MKSKKSLFNFIILVIGILVLVNFLSDSYFFRLDFTADKRYTLSKATIDILSTLKKPVTVKAYFSENLPPDIAKTKRDFKELLVEFANRSKGKVVYEFIDPSSKEEVETQATQAGIQPVMINVREKDQVKQQKAYMGAVVQMGERSEAIPFMKPGAAMEYTMSSTIKKVSVAEKPTIGIVRGHGEPTLRAMQQAEGGLSVLYNVDTVSLAGDAPIPDQIRTLAIIDPKDSFSLGDLKKLDDFLAKGKNIFISYNHEVADLSRASASSRHTGLEDWLDRKGIHIEDQFVVDATCGTINVQQQQGAFTYNSQLQFPYFPLINKFEDHPVTKGLEQVVLRFPSPIKFTGDSSKGRFVPILKSSAKTGTQQPPFMFNIAKNWTNADFPMAELTLGGAITGRLSGDAVSKMIVIANGDFAVNGEGPAAMQVLPDNVNLLVNAIDWLSDDTGLIELRTKGVTSRPLETTEDGTKTFYKYLNFLLPILLIVAYGFIRIQTNRRQRMRRMEENFS